MPTALDNPWRFLLTDATGVVFGELTNATDRTVSEPHMGTASLACTIRLDHELADAVLNEECLVKAYRGPTLVFHGPVVTVEESGTSSGQTIRITAAGAWWRATKRILGASTTENGMSVTPSGGISNALGLILNYGNGRLSEELGAADDDDAWTGIQWSTAGV